MLLTQVMNDDWVAILDIYVGHMLTDKTTYFCWKGLNAVPIIP
jgi:hypothetical protein